MTLIERDNPKTIGAIRVDVVSSRSDTVDRAEAELDARGFPIPLPSRAAWARLFGGPEHRHAIARDASGACRAFVGFSISATRALPFHRVLRLEAVGDAFAAPEGQALLRETVEYARRERRILRVVVEVECRTSQARDEIVRTLESSGFRRAPNERSSARTLAVDLSPDEDALFAAIGKSTRQNIKNTPKNHLQVAALQHPALGDRMSELLAGAFSRTGGNVQRVDWAAVIRLCEELPNRSHLVGVFRGTGRTEDALVGFGWCMHHGDRGEYTHGATARVPGIKIRLQSPVLWELILWAKREGASWFDLGGVTPGSLGSTDALGGISDFKRGFTRNEIAFGQEWVFEPSPVKAAVAKVSTTLMKLGQSLRERAQRAHRATDSDEVSGDQAEGPRPAPGMCQQLRNVSTTLRHQLRGV